MTDIVSSLTQAFTLAFVVTSMFGLGLGMTVQDMLAPLRNARLVLLSLAASFVVMPAVAYALTRILPLDQSLQIGLLILSTVSGAAISIKLAEVSRGNVRFAVSLIALQVVATVIYLPLALPLLIPGIQINPVAIAMPLFLQVLLPLAFGLVMNVRYEEEAVMARPIMGEIANVSLVVMLVLNLGNIGNVLGLLGTGSLLASAIVIASGFGAGYLLGGPDGKTRRTLAFGTAQRNYAAAFVIAEGSFADRPLVLLLLLTASLLSMIILVPLAGEFGRRHQAAGEAEATADVPAPAQRERAGQP